MRGNQRAADERRHLHPDEIDRILRKYAKRIGLDRGYSAHSMRATFITTALDNGASLEDVQRTAGHADPSTLQPDTTPKSGSRAALRFSKSPHL